MGRFLRRRKRGESGKALVEFAIVLPLLVEIVLGTVDIGRAYRLSNELKSAAREGASYAQYTPWRVSQGSECGPGDNVSDISVAEEPDVSAAFTVEVIDTDNGNLAITGCDRANQVPPGHHVLVKVSAPFKPLTPFTGRSSWTVKGTEEVVVQG